MIITSNTIAMSVISQQWDWVTLSHNLPSDADYFVVAWLDRTRIERQLVVRGNELMFTLSSVVQGCVYKLVAYGIQNGVIDGVWWVDNYVYDPGQASITFTNGGNQSGSGTPRSFTGSVQIQGQGVSRRVVAIALDAEPPYLLAQTQSDTNGSYTLDWQGYSGQMLVTALDDYGTDFVAGMTLGVGDRVHPPYPNGYVYESANLGITGAEPTWPNKEGESVTSGEVQLVAVPFWRPKSSGPFSV